MRDLIAELGGASPIDSGRGRDLIAEMGGEIPTYQEPVKEPSFFDRISPYLSDIGAGISADARGQASAGRAALATAGSLAIAPAAGIAGLSKTITSGVTEGGKTLEEISSIPARLVTPDEAPLMKTAELAMRPFQMAGEGLQEIVRQTPLKDTIAEPIAGAIGEVSAMFGLPGVPKTAKSWWNTLPYRKRVMVVDQIQADIANGGFTGADIRKLWKEGDAATKEAFVDRYVKGVEKEAKPAAPRDLMAEMEPTGPRDLLAEIGMDEPRVRGQANTARPPDVINVPPLPAAPILSGSPFRAETGAIAAMERAGLNPAEFRPTQTPAGWIVARRNGTFTPPVEPPPAEIVQPGATSGGTKIVNESGEPLVVYHGTDKPEFDVFKPGWREPAIFLTPVEENAWKYAKGVGTPSPTARVEKMTVDIRNPLIVEGRTGTNGLYPLTEAKMNELRGQGYDGIVSLGPSGKIEHAREIIPFLPEQIKRIAPSPLPEAGATSGGKQPGVDIPRPKVNPAKGPQNLVTYLQKNGFVRLGEYSDKTGDAWDRAHGFRSKNRSREMGDIAAVSRQNGAMSMDEAATNLNSEGWGPQAPNGGEWTANDLFNVLSEKDKGRNIFTPEKSDALIERQIRREEAKHYADIEAGLKEDALDASSREGKESIKSLALDEIAAEEGLTESELAFAMRDADDILSSLEAPTKESFIGKKDTGAISGIPNDFNLINPETEASIPPETTPKAVGGIAVIRKEKYSEKRGTSGAFHDVWRIYDEAGNRIVGVDFSSEIAAISRAKSLGLLPNPSRPPEGGGRLSDSLSNQRGSTGLVNESEILNAILKTQGKIKEAMPHLEALGRSIYEGGKQKFLDWNAKMKSALGDLWESFKAPLKGIWDRLQSGEIGPLGNDRGSVNLGPAVDEVKSILSEAKQTADEYLGAISTRLGNIDPSLKNTLRAFEFRKGMKASEATKKVLPFIEKVSKMPKADKAAFDLARKNGDPVQLKALVTKHGLGKEYHELRNVLADLYKEASAVGYDVGYRQNYHPRVLKDSKGFLEFFYKQNDWPILEKAIRAKETELQRYLTDDEKAKLINYMLRGYPSGNISLSKPGQLKAREIETITPALNKFYMDSDGALLRYISDVTDAIEARKLFGKGPKGGKIGNLNDTIGGYVLDLLNKGKIKPEQERIVRDILDARFNEVGTRGIFGLYKNLSYIDTMGSPISALTQIGDLSWALYKNGIGRTLEATGKAIAGRSPLRKEDIGIERIASEFADTSKAARAVDKTFRVIGLSKMDNIGKESLINSTYAKAKQQAMTDRGTAALRKELEPIFEGETDQLIKDLRTGKITENVKLYLFNTLSDFQPISLSEMPQKYLSGGNGRILYMLKSFTLKQFDIYRREAFQKIAKEGTRIQGLKNLVWLTATFAAANAGADVIKDLLLGRDINLEDKAVDNMLRLLGISKFVTWKAREEGVGSALVRQIAPPFKALDAISKDINSTGDGKGLEVTQSIPVVGKLYYWWFGKGADKTERKQNRNAPATLVNPKTLRGLR